MLAESSGFASLAEALVGQHALTFSALENYDSIDGLERVAFMKSFFNSTGIMLDPVYGFHVAAALLSDMQQNPEGPYILVNSTKATLPYFNYQVE